MLRKNTLILFLLLLAGFTNAQVVLQGNDTVYTSGPATEFEIVAYANVINNGENPVNLRWVKLNNNIVSGWSSTICDVNACYPSTTDSADFTLAARATGNVDGHFYPNNVVGNGTMRVRIYEVGNPSNQLFITFIGSTNAASVSLLTKPVLKMYPVPAQDYLTLETQLENGNGTAEIFNAIGKKVADFHLNGNKTRISIGHLPKGHYLVRVNTGKGIITKQIVKL
jgi:hypothetical protein